jgi:regulator of sigma E protease
MFDFLSYIPLVGNTLTFVVPFIIVLSIVIFIHEFGHYIVGRWCGIHAEAFSMGFGPVLKSWHDKRGTKWQIAALPFGGFVKFLGDANGASAGVDRAAVAALPKHLKDRTFEGAALWKRALTVFAGPAANFFLSIAIFGMIAIGSGQQSEELMVGDVLAAPNEMGDLQVGDTITAFKGQPIVRWKDFEEFKYRESAGSLPIYGVLRDGVALDVTGPFPWLPIVSSVNPVTPAAKAGVKKGDLVVSVDGQIINSFFELQTIVQNMISREVPMKVFRDGEMVDLKITPRLMPYEKNDGGFGERMMIGIGAGLSVLPRTDSVGLLGGLDAGVGSVWYLTKNFARTISELVTGGLSVKNLQGPVGIAVASGDSASQGPMEFVFMIAFISTAIGLMNLLPIPILDGGHLVIFAYQAVFRRAPNDRVIQVIMGVGLCLLLMLMIFATFNDIMRL